MPPQLPYLDLTEEAPLAITAAPRTIPSRQNISPRPHQASALQNVMMRTHNQARARIGAPDLAWDTELAKDAALYAGSLARSGRFAHDPQRGRKERQGENLWMGTRNAYSHADMVGFWVDEDRYFKRGRFPANSTTGNWSDIGHYTQIIWPTTRRVGCAMVNNQSYDYLVCRYSPAGNVMGRDPLKG